MAEPQQQWNQPAMPSPPPTSQPSYYIPASPLPIFPQQPSFTPIPRSPLMTAATVLLVLMLLIGGSLILYTTVYIPHKVSSEAAATAVTQTTQIAKANA